MNEPLDERLRQHLLHLDDVATRGADAVRSAVADVVGRRQRAQRTGAALASAALIIGVVVAVAAHRGAPDVATPATSTTPATTTAVTTTATDPSTTVVQVPGSWHPLSPDPRGVDWQPAAVWTGSEALVVGGVGIDGTPVGGAVAYNPTTDSWRRLAEPLNGGRALDPLAVWTGKVLLLVGGASADPGPPIESAGQAYDPLTDTWRYIAPPIGTISDRSPFVWTGTRLLVWPGEGHPPTGATPVAYDPVADSWTAIARPPVVARESAASVWTGEEWIVWGGTTGTEELADGAAYDPATDTWRMLAPGPLSKRRVRAVWTGTAMFVDAGSEGGDRATGDGELALADGALYDPTTDRWRSITSGPAHPGFVPLWTGKEVVMFAKGNPMIYDLGADRWIDACCSGGVGALGTPVWTGSVVLLIGGGDPAAGGASFAPP